jgi:hypothetical protein
LERAQGNSRDKVSDPAHWLQPRPRFPHPNAVADGTERAIENAAFSVMPVPLKTSTDHISD